MRLSVIGTSCSGKSTLAKKIAEKLKIEYIELDKIFWNPHWQMTPEKQFIEKVHNKIQNENWVICGNYSAVQEMIWQRSTHVVWLNYPFYLVFYRALKRTLKRVIFHEECCNGNHETFKLAFLSKHSILLWVLKTYKKNKIKYSRVIESGKFEKLQFIELKRPEQTEKWLDQLL